MSSRENSGACPTCGQPTLKVLTANWRMSRDEMEAIRSAWEEAAKDPRMIVLNGGLKLEELTDEDLARVGLQRIEQPAPRIVQMIMAWARAHPGELPEAFVPMLLNLEAAYTDAAGQQERS